MNGPSVIYCLDLAVLIEAKVQKRGDKNKMSFQMEEPPFTTKYMKFCMIMNITNGAENGCS